jgi:hypothetical protein
MLSRRAKRTIIIVFPLVVFVGLYAFLARNVTSEFPSLADCHVTEHPPPPPRPGRPVPGGGALALGIGGDKSCAAMKDGHVWCWGSERVERRFAQAWGPDEPLDLPVRSLATILGEVKERPLLLSQDSSGYACGVFPTRVRCWDVEKPSVEQPTPRTGAFVTLWIAEHSACAKTDAGAVSCWGTGVPWVDAGEPLAPTRMPGLDGADEVEICPSMVCARRGTSVECTPSAPLEELRMTRPPDPARLGVDAIGLSCCDRRMCALTPERDVVCWSSEQEPTRVADHAPEFSTGAQPGALCGFQTDGAERDRAVKRVTALASTCWVERDGTVACTGVPAGNGVELDTVTIHPLPGITSATDAIIDRNEWCVQSRDATWTCWPRLREYLHGKRLSESDWPIREPPEAVSGSIGSRTVAQNRFAFCLIDGNGRARCKRRSLEGTLGQEIVLLNVERLSIGNNHACALDRGGGVSCWGANESGEVLGESRSDFVETPTHVMDEVADVAVGLRHTCVVRRSGSLVCFGDNRSGQLGNGTTAPAPGFVDVTGPAQHATRVVAGFDHTCALTEGGSVFCWGSDSTDSHAPPGIVTVPTRVEGFTDPVRAVVAARDGSCALLADGSVACWGRGVWGNSRETRPKRVGATEGTVELGMGDYHACVRNAAGRVRCFGSNEEWQLGVDLPPNRVELRAGHGCPSVTFFQVLASPTALDVVW